MAIIEIKKPYCVIKYNDKYQAMNNDKMSQEIFETALLVDSFDDPKYAEEVATALNDGYFYSSEHGIECHIMQAERIWNDRSEE